jgi:hypothetical protein
MQQQRNPIFMEASMLPLEIWFYANILVALSATLLFVDIVLGLQHLIALR